VRTGIVATNWLFAAFTIETWSVVVT